MYKLNEKEKACLKTIARRIRINYLEKNKYTYLEDDIDIIDENVFISKETVESEFEIKIDKDLCAHEIEYIFRDPYMLKSTKTLNYREKLVLFSYYLEDKTDEQIGKMLHIKGDSIRKIRKRAQEKIRNKYEKIKEEKKNNGV